MPVFIYHDNIKKDKESRQLTVASSSATLERVDFLLILYLQSLQESSTLNSALQKLTNSSYSS
ncbi:unnamed protein product [Ceratitis capitata]|uniref:(Mediterranean fruit fly) hypothetical protein n=1 Tax=Ceratitis capitata TaxID=7213 RepID=A0A811UCT6_CERCA|nr:unnamed protein product [Ceratitis capitata]